MQQEFDFLPAPQRHTLYDDEEEEEEEEGLDKKDSLFTVSPSSALLKRGGAILIAIGKASTVFARSCLLLQTLKPSCILTSDSGDVFKDASFPAEVSRECNEVTVSELYEAKAVAAEEGSAYVCLHNRELRSECCNLWAEKLLNEARPCAVLVLCSLPAHCHLSGQSVNSASFLRGVQTSTWTYPPLTAFLEPPSALTGESAAIITRCQAYGTAASGCVLYSSVSESDECLAALKPLLNHPFFANNFYIKSDGEATQLVKQLWPKPRQDLSTLYT